MDEDSTSRVCYTIINMKTHKLFVGEGQFREVLSHILADQPAIKIIAGAGSRQEV
jgi:hypothetical protein